MANIINGTDTGIGGLITTGDVSDELQLQTAETTAITITSGQQSAFIAGTASAPAVTTTGDTNTGIFFPAADTIAFAEGGAEAMRIDSSGNVGIGTGSGMGFANYQVVGVGGGASAGGILQFQTTAGTDGAHIRADRSGATLSSLIVETRTSSPLLFGTNGTERMRIDSSGKLLVGSTSALNVGSGGITSTVSSGANIALEKSTGGSISFYQSGVVTSQIEDIDSQGGLRFYTGTSGSLSERMRINSSGNVGIQNNAPSSLLTVGSKTTAVNPDVSTTFTAGGASAAGSVFRAATFCNTATATVNNEVQITFTPGTNYSAVGAIGAQIENTTDAASCLKFYSYPGGGPLTERARITSQGYLRLASGTGGIQFNGDTAAVNALDDYEEGTYTPVIIFNSGTPTYSYQEGYYTKIGRQVFGGGIIGINNNSTIGGFFGVSLPFTLNSGTFGYTVGSSSDGSGFTWPITVSGDQFYSITWQGSPGVARMLFVGIGPSAQLVPYSSTGIGNSWYLRFNFSFYTT